MRMLRVIMIVGAALALTSCGPTTAAPPGSAGSTAPPASEAAPSITPLGSTYIDDKAVSLAWDALEATRVSVDAAVQVCIDSPTSRLCKLKPGSPTANKIADGLAGTKQWLLAARAAQKAGEAAGYGVAMDQASLAFRLVKDGIVAFKGGN